jgi:hypothetical protein
VSSDQSRKIKLLSSDRSEGGLVGELIDTECIREYKCLVAHLVDELIKGRYVCVLVGIAVDMIEFDIGDDTVVWIQVENVLVKLVSFYDETKLFDLLSY